MDIKPKREREKETVSLMMAGCFFAVPMLPLL